MDYISSSSGILLKTLIFVLFSFNSFGQIKYVDVVPDQTITPQNDVEFDLNGDGLGDITFIFELKRESDVDVYKFDVKTAADVQVAVTNNDVSALKSYEMIDDNLDWSNSSTTYLLGYYRDGNWDKVEEGFIGVKIRNNNQTNFAWIRINKSYRRNLRIADFAYNPNIDEGIKAGTGIPSGATSVYGCDTADYMDARDIYYSFTKAFDETNLSAYQLMVAKENDSMAYNLEYMNQLPEERYIKILVDSTNSDYTFTGTLSQTDSDINGDRIEQLTDYKTHVLNISKTGIPEDNYLSTPSKAFYLQAFPAAVINPVAFDNGNTNTMDDVGVSFDAIENEDFIDEYLIYISNADDAAHLGVDDLLNLGENYYTSYTPNGSHIDLKLNSDQRITNGNAIINNMPYSALVMSVADSSFSFTSNVSNPSRPFILKEPDDFKAGQKQGEHITYFAINPAHQIGRDSSGFDIDQDGTDDIGFFFENDGSPMSWITRIHLFPKGNNKILICEHDEHPNWTALLSENHQISEDYNWYDKNTIIYDYFSDGWNGAYHEWGHFEFNNFYIGVCLMDRDTPAYAWVHMENISWLSLQITEVAFCDAINAIDEIEKSNLTRVYPNPASNYITIELLSEKSQIAEVKLFNSFGLLVDTRILDKRINYIDIKNYSPGIYYYTIGIKGKNIETHKVIVY